MDNKFNSMLKSRRFWLAVSGVVFVALKDQLGLDIDQEQFNTISLLIVSWIVGDSLRKT